MKCKLLDFALWFSSYWCLKFMELFESEKSRFSIFPVLKKLIKTKKVRNHLEPNTLVSYLFSENSIKNQPFFFWFFPKNLILSLPGIRYVSPNTNLPLNRNISKTESVNIAFTILFFRSHLISFLMIYIL